MSAAAAVGVRRAKPADVDAVRMVGVVTWPPTYGPLHGTGYVMRGLDDYWNAPAIADAVDAGAVDVAEVQDEIVGMTHVEPLGDDLVMWKLYVVPDAQGSGAGRALIDAAKARATRARRHLLTEHDPANARASAFYARHDFEPTAPPFAGTDAVWLRWRQPTRA